ncbi:gastric inhibitory polypeptide [Osmerus mordax]|uniref:gastric inhibitory polypeptide n=1 Tax=Osmerus mordax TaxID=8014 RepID=UPI003510C8A7
MKVELFAIVFLCLAGMLHAEAKAQQPGESSLTDNGQRLGRRYAESTIASDMSKIMDSMVQKNFVNFLLNQREKKNAPNVTPEYDPEFHMYSDLLKKIAVCVRSKDL